MARATTGGTDRADGADRADGVDRTDGALGSVGGVEGLRGAAARLRGHDRHRERFAEAGLDPVGVERAGPLREPATTDANRPAEGTWLRPVRPAGPTGRVALAAAER